MGRDRLRELLLRLPAFKEANAFPVFFWDNNCCCKHIRAPEDIESVITGNMAHHRMSRAAALKMIGDAKIATRERELPEDPEHAKLAKAFDGGYGREPSFGYRREHIGGAVTLLEWLQVREWGQLLDADPGPEGG